MKLNDNDILELLDLEELPIDIKSHLENDDDFIKYATMKAEYLEIKNSSPDATSLENFNKLNEIFPEMKELFDFKNQSEDKNIHEDSNEIIDKTVSSKSYMPMMNKMSYGVGTSFIFAMLIIFVIPMFNSNNQIQYYDFRNINSSVLRSGSNALKMIDLKDYNKDEIIEFSKKNNFS